LELLDDYKKWRDQFLDEKNQLKPQYQPKSMVPTFMEEQEEPAVVKRQQIPVPKDQWKFGD